VPYVPSLIRVRPYNLIRHLAALGHQVAVATLWSDVRERQDVDELRRHDVAVEAFHLPTWRSLVNCAFAVPGGQPLQARYSYLPLLEEHVRRQMRDVDVVHVEHLRGAPYALAAASNRAASNTPVIWDSVDCITHLFEQAAAKRRDRLGRLINRFELPRTRKLEASLVSRFDRVLVTSGVDRQALLDLDPHRASDTPGAVAVLTNGVDLGYFCEADEPREPDTLVFSGKMSYHANESAVVHLMRDIMPRVWASRPSTRLVVVGKDPSERLQGLLAAESNRVSVTGTVSDIRPYLRRASMAVVPLVYGAGCQNKVLESMACGTPVVATPQAVSALSARPGQDVFVADGAEPFARAVVGLLDDPQRRRTVGTAGRRYVETHHKWDQIAGRLEAIYEEAIAERRQAPAPRPRASLSALSA